MKQYLQNIGKGLKEKVVIIEIISNLIDRYLRVIYMKYLPVVLRAELRHHQGTIMKNTIIIEVIDGGNLIFN